MAIRYGSPRKLSHYPQEIQVGVWASAFYQAPWRSWCPWTPESLRSVLFLLVSGGHASPVLRALILRMDLRDTPGPRRRPGTSCQPQHKGQASELTALNKFQEKSKLSPKNLNVSPHSSLMVSLKSLFGGGPRKVPSTLNSSPSMEFYTSAIYSPQSHILTSRKTTLLRTEYLCPPTIFIFWNSTHQCVDDGTFRR